MSARGRQFARLARVRRVQHGLAAAGYQRAAAQVETLEATAERLAELRDGFAAGEGAISAASLASLGEMAMRLDAARADMGKSIAGARTNAARCSDSMLLARRHQESAERLHERTALEAMRAAERKQGAALRPRRRLSIGNHAHDADKS